MAASLDIFFGLCLEQLCRSFSAYMASRSLEIDMEKIYDLSSGAWGSCMGIFRWIIKFPQGTLEKNLRDCCLYCVSCWCQCCPGFVLTDMTADLPDNFYGGNRVTTAEGADTPVFLALLPPCAKEPKGQFLMRRKAYDFVTTDVTIQIWELVDSSGSRILR